MTATEPNITECPQCGKRNRVPAAANGVPRCGNCHNPLPWITAAIPTLLVMSGGEVKGPPRRCGVRGRHPPVGDRHDRRRRIGNVTIRRPSDIAPG
jgi:hypothetical protein